MNHKAANRAAPGGRKVLSQHTKAVRAPQLQRRGHSNHSVACNASRNGQHPNDRPITSRRSSHERTDSTEDDREGVTSFLQFCATCEKQIDSPDSSILYCSNACRNKDASSSTPVEIQLPKRVKQFKPPAFGIPIPDIVPQRSPTVPRTLSWRIPDLEHCASAERNRHQLELKCSDRQRSSSSSLSLDKYERQGPAQASRDASRLPSLVNSPSSSVSTLASNVSYGSPAARRHSNAVQFPHEPGGLATPICSITAPSSLTNVSGTASRKSSVTTVLSLQTVEGANLTFGKRQ